MEKVTKDYHVFTDGRDEYYLNFRAALKQFNKWAAKYGTARLYVEIFVDDELEVEDCLVARGSFPW